MKNIILILLVLCPLLSLNAAEVWFVDDKGNSYEKPSYKLVKFSYLEILKGMDVAPLDRGQYNQAIKMFDLFIKQFYQALIISDINVGRDDYSLISSGKVKDVADALEELTGVGDMIVELFGTLKFDSKTAQKLYDKTIEELKSSIVDITKIREDIETRSKNDKRMSLKEAYESKLMEMKKELNGVTMYEMKYSTIKLTEDNSMVHSQQVLTKEYRDVQKKISAFMRLNNYGRKVDYDSVKEYNPAPEDEK